MPNKPYAVEWLFFAKRNIDTAVLLYNVNHYEDIIGIELQQALEKVLKSVCAFQNLKIPKEHDLVKIYFLTEPFIVLAEKEIVILRMATDYYKEDRYPNPYYQLPSREEIKDVLDFTMMLFETVCKTLDIKTDETTCKV